MGVNTSPPNPVVVYHQSQPAAGQNPLLQNITGLMGCKAALLSLLALGLVGANFQPFIYYKFPPPPLPKLFPGQNLEPDLGLGLPIFKDTFKPLSASSELSADTFLPASKQYKDTFLPVSIISKDRKRGFERIVELRKKDWDRMGKKEKIDNLSVSSVP